MYKGLGNNAIVLYKLFIKVVKTKKQLDFFNAIQIGLLTNNSNFFKINF